MKLLMDDARVQPPFLARRAVFPDRFCRGMTIRASIRMVILLALEMILGGWHSAAALDTAMDVNEYAHTAWTVRDGFSLGNIYAIAQTPDGYLWLGSEFGLFRFDGTHNLLWQPPSGYHFPDGINALMVSRDGTLWIGTFGGLVKWELARDLHRPYVWPQRHEPVIDMLGGGRGAPAARLEAMRDAIRNAVEKLPSHAAFLQQITTSA